jgi:hypothetical protein
MIYFILFLVFSGFLLLVIKLKLGNEREHNRQEAIRNFPSFKASELRRYIEEVYGNSIYSLETSLEEEISLEESEDFYRVWRNDLNILREKLLKELNPASINEYNSWLTKPFVEAKQEIFDMFVKVNTRS